MNFAEVRFWEYLLVGLGVLVIARFSIALARPTVLPVFDKLALLTLGLSLLVCMSWVTFLIFLVVAVGTYFGLAWIISYHARHASKYFFSSFHFNCYLCFIPSTRILWEITCSDSISSCWPESPFQWEFPSIRFKRLHLSWIPWLSNIPCPAFWIT